MNDSSNESILRPNPIKAQFNAPNFDIVTNTKTCIIIVYKSKINNRCESINSGTGLCHTVRGGNINIQTPLSQVKCSKTFAKEYCLLTLKSNKN